MQPPQNSPPTEITKIQITPTDQATKIIKASNFVQNKDTQKWQNLRIPPNVKKPTFFPSDPNVQKNLIFSL